MPNLLADKKKEKSLLDLIKPYLSDYEQLIEKDAPLRKQYEQFKKNVSQHIPANKDFRNPKAMFDWSMATALNSPMGLGMSKVTLPETAFSRAHAIAQKNAALPIEQGGLGLPPNNTAMDRARAMDVTYDRSLNAIKSAYEEGLKKRDTIIGGKSPYSSTGEYLYFNNIYNESPIKSAAFKAGIENKEMPYLSTGFRLGKAPKEGVSRNGRSGGTEAGVSMAKMYYPDKSHWLNTPTAKSLLDDKTEYARKKLYYEGWNIPETGSDGEPLFIDLKNISKKKAESGFIEPTVTLTNGQKRSRFAAFDPMQKNSANILASGLLGSTLLNKDKERK